VPSAGFITVSASEDPTKVPVTYVPSAGSIAVSASEDPTNVPDTRTNVPVQCCLTAG
jgi:hypothetical protein